MIRESSVRRTRRHSFFCHQEGCFCKGGENRSEPNKELENPEERVYAGKVFCVRKGWRDVNAGGVFDGKPVFPQQVFKFGNVVFLVVFWVDVVAEDAPAQFSLVGCGENECSAVFEDAFHFIDESAQLVWRDVFDDVKAEHCIVCFVLRGNGTGISREGNILFGTQEACKLQGAFLVVVPVELFDGIGKEFFHAPVSAADVAGFPRSFQERARKACCIRVLVVEEFAEVPVVGAGVRVDFFHRVFGLRWCF